MLEDALAAFLKHIRPERAFDEPLMALLRAEGFERVRLTHGNTEFGKDIIAQRDGEQWAWQSKIGDVTQNFRDMAGQLDELRISNIAHPDFDLSLPRRAVLVTTGRLKGNGIISMREYNERAAARGEPELEHWDRDILVGKLAGNPDAALRGTVDGRLLSLLGVIDARTVTMDDLDAFSRRWELWEPDRVAGIGVLECAIVCDRLRASDRLDLACHAALCLVRAAGAATFDADAEQPAILGGEALFSDCARQLWAECDARQLSEDGMVAFSGQRAWATYALRCVRLAELLGLLAIMVEDDEPALAAEIIAWLAQFVQAQPGTAHAPGDRYAVSGVPVVLALHRGGETASAKHLVERSAVWMADRYDSDELGLADHQATPREEIDRILGASFEAVREPRRRESHLAAVLLDLCALLSFSELYALIRNDVLAVNALPAQLLPGEGVDRLLQTGPSNRWDVNPDYSDELGTQTAAPHLDLARSAAAMPKREAWRLLAASAALRDRHFVTAIAALATAPTREPAQET